jgi:hypothetical protein
LLLSSSASTLPELRRLLLALALPSSSPSVLKTRVLSVAMPEGSLRRRLKAFAVEPTNAALQ